MAYYTHEVEYSELSGTLANAVGDGPQFYGACGFTLIYHIGKRTQHVVLDGNSYRKDVQEQCFIDFGGNLIPVAYSVRVWDGNYMTEYSKYVEEINSICIGTGGYTYKEIEVSISGSKIGNYSYPSRTITRTVTIDCNGASVVVVDSDVVGTLNRINNISVAAYYERQQGVNEAVSDQSLGSSVAYSYTSDVPLIAASGTC